VEYEARCREAEQRINARFGGRGDAVTMLYPNGGENHRARALAALSLADVVLVNPTFDGLNMVAKESLVVNQRSSVLLSRNAGAFDQLSPAVTALDPFDVLSTSDLLETALGEPNRSTTPAAASCLDALRQESAGNWLRRIMAG
jgi:trehalose 6-phosphate synthase